MNFTAIVYVFIVLAVGWGIVEVIAGQPFDGGITILLAYANHLWYRAFKSYRDTIKEYLEERKW